MHWVSPIKRERFGRSTQAIGSGAARSLAFTEARRLDRTEAPLLFSQPRPPNLQHLSSVGLRRRLG
jgi:hypothetical protein